MAAPNECPARPIHGAPFSCHQRNGRFHLQDLLGPGGLFKASLTLAVAGKIEPQGHEPGFVQRAANAPQDTGVPGAGKTVPGNDGANRRPLRLVQGAGKDFAHMIVELDLLFHYLSAGRRSRSQYTNKIHAMNVKAKSLCETDMRHPAGQSLNGLSG
jgi:hypothetical protein